VNSVGGGVVAMTREVALVLLVVFVRVVGVICEHVRKDVIEIVDKIILEVGALTACTLEDVVLVVLLEIPANKNEELVGGVPKEAR
jgi:hypothetical protein